MRLDNVGGITAEPQQVCASRQSAKSNNSYNNRSAKGGQLDSAPHTARVLSIKFANTENLSADR